MIFVDIVTRQSARTHGVRVVLARGILGLTPQANVVMPLCGNHPSRIAAADDFLNVTAVPS